MVHVTFNNNNAKNQYEYFSIPSFLLTTEYVNDIWYLAEETHERFCDWHSKSYFENEEKIRNRIQHRHEN